ncbi:MAG: helix-turn-helix domain-containing protein [Oscillospiraceae bacterium]|nr:helix-turn-helix domain-containing protein [Oscillospiraceae bacterium]
MLHLRLLELRKKKGITQAEIAGLLSITPQAYSLYETSKNNVNNETLCYLADYYNVTTDYLLGRQESIPSFLNADEKTVIEQYKVLDERSKSAVKNCLAFEYSKTPKTADIKKSAM